MATLDWRSELNAQRPPHRRKRVRRRQHSEIAINCLRHFGTYATIPNTMIAELIFNLVVSCFCAATYRLRA